MFLIEGVSSFLLFDAICIIVVPSLVSTYISCGMFLIEGVSSQHLFYCIDPMIMYIQHIMNEDKCK